MTGGIVLLSAVSANAITLGAIRGTPVLGQPLRLVVEATLDGDEAPDPRCLGAEFVYGDTPVSPLRVRATLSDARDAAGKHALHLEADTPVNEPIVSVTVRTVCAPRIQRQYTLFAELGEPDIQTPRAPLPAVTVPVAAVAGVAAQPVGGAPLPAPGDAKAPAPRATQASAAPKPPRPPQSRTPSARPRLKLDMLDDLEPGAPVLKQSWSLSAWQEASSPRREEAARWWSLLNAEPSQRLEQGLQAKQYEEQVRQLKQAAAKDRAQQARLREQLQAAEDAQYTNPLIYALAGVSALAVALALWAVLRLQRSRSRPWWHAVQPDSSDNLPLTEVAAVDASAPGGGWVDRLRRGIGSKTGKDAQRKFGEDNTPFKHQEPAAEADSDLSPLGFSKGMLSTYVETPRTIKTEELFDIQQQADFFVSLGQHEQAIELLIHHIRDNEETSPMAYLDLLKIYHSLGQRREYDQIRETFNRIFTASVPDMDAFNQPTYGLEAYPSALNRIEALWPSPKVLDVIEESIFRKPGHNPRHAFTLEAYRELLLLHAMVKGYIEPPSVVLAESRRSTWMDQQEKAPKADFGDTQVNPLSTTEFVNSVQPDIQEALASGLDIDLGAFEPDGATPDLPGIEPAGAPEDAGAPATPADTGFTPDLDLLLSEPTDTTAPHPIFAAPSIEPPPGLPAQTTSPSASDMNVGLDEWLNAEAAQDAADRASLDFDLSQFDASEQTMRIVKKP